MNLYFNEAFLIEDFDENILNYNTTPRKSLGWKHHERFLIIS
jgi:hypothetical protein